jgi:hypothetical protein
VDFCVNTSDVLCPIFPQLVDEALDLLTMKNLSFEDSILETGDWVRPTSGQYHGNLALILDSEYGMTASILLPPRLSLSTQTLKRKLSSSARPAAKLFNPEVVCAQYGVLSVTHRGCIDIFKNDRFFHGLLLKNMGVENLAREQQRP